VDQGQEPAASGFQAGAGSVLSAAVLRPMFTFEPTSADDCVRLARRRFRRASPRGTPASSEPQLFPERPWVPLPSPWSRLPCVDLAATCSRAAPEGRTPVSCGRYGWVPLPRFQSWNDRRRSRVDLAAGRVPQLRVRHGPGPEHRPKSGRGLSCAYQKSNPDIFVMQSAEDWAAKNTPCPFYGAR
jgi:hypothetical protein